jgi:hypothetical protein
MHKNLIDCSRKHVEHFLILTGIDFWSEPFAQGVKRVLGDLDENVDDLATVVATHFSHGTTNRILQRLREGAAITQYSVR